MEHVECLLQNYYDTLNDYEKEKAYHRAYSELITDHIFEFDIQFGTVEYFDYKGKTDKEYCRMTDMSRLSAKELEELLELLKEASSKNPIVKNILKYLRWMNHLT